MIVRRSKSFAVGVDGGRGTPMPLLRRDGTQTGNDTTQ